MRKQVYIINGSNGVGKDTVVSLVGEYFWVIGIDSVAVVKDCAEKLGWDGEKTEDSRLFLSELKKLADKHFNHSTQYICSSVRNFLYDNDDVAFIHIREPESIDRIKKWCENADINCKTILVTNSNVEVANNKSDMNVNNYKYDIYINNNGTLGDLENEVYNKIVKGLS